MKKLFILFLLLAFAVSVQAAGPISFGGSGTGDMLSTNNLSDVASAAAARASLNLVIASDVQAYDADLSTYAGTTPNTNGLSLIATTYANMKNLLDVEIGTDVQAYNANLTTFAGIAPSANVQAILNSATYAAIKALLDLEIGTDVQAYTAVLSQLGALVATPSGAIISVDASGNFVVATSLSVSQIVLGGITINSATQPTVSGGLGFGGTDLKYYNTALRTVANTDETQTWTNKVLTAPRIQGYEKIASGDTTLVATDVYGTRINNYGQTTNTTITLPTCNYGMDTVFVFGTATPASYTVSVPSGYLYYSGGYSSKVSITPAVGDYFVLYSFQTGAATWQWILKNGQGTIATSNT
jgi:hypothetical protein